ncbi:hypothetical protein VTL71DRAFT_3212 [Oculimacula yallundae]|uniref:Uncharacterized protein n=1 Tax=Oculimacula yallundae TaxID=86028 RepID=A0ABR4C6H3_9HELO
MNDPAPLLGFTANSVHPRPLLQHSDLSDCSLPFPLSLARTRSRFAFYKYSLVVQPLSRTKTNPLNTKSSPQVDSAPLR